MKLYEIYDAKNGLRKYYGVCKDVYRFLEIVEDAWKVDGLRFDRNNDLDYDYRIIFDLPNGEYKAHYIISREFEIDELLSI